MKRLFFLTFACAGLSAALGQAPTPPTITTQPKPITVAAGANAVFTVAATDPTGSGLLYQWRFGSSILANATNATLTLSKVTRADSGVYAVDVSTRLGGVAHSQGAPLTVTTPPSPPAIVEQPRHQSIADGANLLLSVTATGTEPMTYQWRRNGANLTAFQNATLLYLSFPATQAGSYDVVVRNALGAVTSVVAVVKISGPALPPQISEQPVSSTVPTGGTYELSVAATGSQPLAYQWFKNGQIIANATGAALELADVDANAAADYTVQISNSAGKVTSQPATVSVSTASASGETWTLLVYGHADHNLSQSLIDDMLEMERVGSADGFNIVVQSDFNGRAKDLTGLPADLKQGVTRFLMQANADSDDLISQPVQRLPELNQDDPAVLTDFIRWGITTYPAARYGLVLWDHGGQWSGFGGDSQDGTVDGTPINTTSIKSAVLSALQATGVAKLDFFAFDTCLMGGAEVLEDMPELSDTYLACPEVDFGPGWDYTATFGFLKENPGMAARDFAYNEVEQWRAHHFRPRGNDGLYGAHAAYDLTKYPGFKSAFFSFIGPLKEFAKTNLTQLLALRRKTTQYTVGDEAAQKSDTEYADLGELALRLAGEPTASPALKAAALALVGSIDNLIINKALGVRKSNALALSVYFPISETYGDAYAALNIFTEDKNWPQFLDLVAGGVTANTEAPAVTNGSSTTQSASRSVPARLAWNIAPADDLYNISAYLVSDTYTGDPSETVYLGQLFTTHFPAALQGEFLWNGTAPVLWSANSDGGTYLGGFMDPEDSSKVTSYAEYLSPDESETRFVILKTDLGGENPHISEVLDGESGGLAPRGIELLPGGLLTPVYLMRRSTNHNPADAETSSVLADSSLLIPAEGVAGINVAWAYLAPATYTVALESEDYFGNLSKPVEFDVTVAPEPLELRITAFSDGFAEVSWSDSRGDAMLLVTDSLGVWDTMIPEDYIDSDGERRSFVFVPEQSQQYFRLSRP